MECNLAGRETYCTMREDAVNPGMPALAMTYSPWQQWDAVYESDIALCRGTIFPCLDKPFLEGACPCV